MLFAFTACDNGTSNNNSPLVNNPPQSDQLSYETNKDGYIISCVLTIDGETFTYQCKGENYLLIDNTDGNYVISEQMPIPDSYIGASETVKLIYFYEGTAQKFAIREGRHDGIAYIGTHIQIFNRSGKLIVDQTPRNDFEDYYYSLIYSNSGWPALFDNLGQPAQDSNGNYIVDEKAVVIAEHLCQRIENGVLSSADLASTYYYDIDTGNVIYSKICNPDFTNTITVYHRKDFYMTYQEILGEETLTKRFYNSDGSFYEKVTDKYEREIISEGEYDANGSLIAPSQD